MKVKCIYKHFFDDSLRFGKEYTMNEFSKSIVDEYGRTRQLNCFEGKYCLMQYASEKWVTIAEFEGTEEEKEMMEKVVCLHKEANDSGFRWGDKYFLTNLDGQHYIQDECKRMRKAYHSGGDRYFVYTNSYKKKVLFESLEKVKEVVETKLISEQLCKKLGVQLNEPFRIMNTKTKSLLDSTYWIAKEDIYYRSLHNRTRNRCTHFNIIDKILNGEYVKHVAAKKMPDEKVDEKDFRYE